MNNYLMSHDTMSTIRSLKREMLIWTLQMKNMWISVNILWISLTGFRVTTQEESYSQAMKHLIVSKAPLLIHYPRIFNHIIFCNKTGKNNNCTYTRKVHVQYIFIYVHVYLMCMYCMNACIITITWLCIHIWICTAHALYVCTCSCFSCI